MKFVNMCPHKLVIAAEDATAADINQGKKILLTLEPSGTVARVDVDTQVTSYLARGPEEDTGTYGAVPVFKAQMGSVQHLPAPEDGTIYVVSFLVAQAAAREDVLSPGELIRGEDGMPIACRGLAQAT